MDELDSAMPENLSEKERQIFEFVSENWPTTPIEIAEFFNEDTSTREQRKRLSTKYSYYIKKLVENKLILSKKAGNAIIVWPLLAEKYRVIHDILKNDSHFQIVSHINSQRYKHA
jgi:predicted transcriptional regulator